MGPLPCYWMMYLSPQEKRGPSPGTGSREWLSCPWPGPQPCPFDTHQGPLPIKTRTCSSHGEAHAVPKVPRNLSCPDCPPADLKANECFIGGKKGRDLCICGGASCKLVNVRLPPTCLEAHLCDFQHHLPGNEVTFHISGKELGVWWGDTETYSDSVSVTGSLWPCANTPSPLHGQGCAESSLLPPRNPSLHPVPPLLMCWDLPFALGSGLGSHLQMVPSLLWLGRLSEWVCEHSFGHSAPIKGGSHVSKFCFHQD